MPHSLRHITAEEIPQDWIDAVREIVLREGWPMRGHATTPCIEMKNPNTNQWLPKMLPGGGVRFSSNEERDLVLRKLEGA